VGFGDIAAVSMCGKNYVCVCWERTKKKKVGVERGPSGAAPGLTFSADSGCRPIRAGVGANCLACGVDKPGTVASENLQPLNNSHRSESSSHDSSSAISREGIMVSDKSHDGEMIALFY